MASPLSPSIIVPSSKRVMNPEVHVYLVATITVAVAGEKRTCPSNRYVCAAHGCDAPGSISRSTRGAGPWFCSKHADGIR